MPSEPTCIIKHVMPNNCLLFEDIVTFVNILFRTSPIAGDTVENKPVFVILVVHYMI